MTIEYIITKKYNELNKLCKNKDVLIYHQTPEDYLHLAMISSLIKYKDSDLDIENGIQLIRQEYLLQLIFAKKKINGEKDLIVYVSEFPEDFLENIPDADSCDY